jgi:hypothetical protein
MKGTGRLIVGVENKKGDIYVVALTESQQGYVQDLICQLHGGTIEVIRLKMPMEFIDKPKRTKKKSGGTK